MMGRVDYSVIKEQSTTGYDYSTNVLKVKGFWDILRLKTEILRLERCADWVEGKGGVLGFGRTGALDQPVSALPQPNLLYWVLQGVKSIHGRFSRAGRSGW